MFEVFTPPTVFDAAGVTKCRAEIDAHARAKSNVVIDMSGVDMIDGSGFGVIAYMVKRLAVSGRKVSVANVRGQPLKLMTRTGLLSALAPDAQALGALGNRISETKRAAAASVVAKPSMQEPIAAGRQKSAA